MLQTQLAGGSDFDVVTIKEIPGYGNLVAQGLLGPLDDFIAEEGIDTSLYGGTTEQVTVDNHHPAGVEPGTTLGSITGLALNKNATNKAAALDFIKWVTGEAGAKEIAKTGTIPAIHTEAVMEEIADMDGFPQDQNSKEALSTKQIYLDMPFNIKAGEVEIVMNEEHTEIMSGTKTIEQGLADMSSRVEQILKDE
jgi:ABC-type glycerol-3-phosphate transport system substrate-binding protein